LRDKASYVSADGAPFILAAAAVFSEPQVERLAVAPAPGRLGSVERIDLAQQARAMTRGQFAARYPHGFMVLNAVADTIPPGNAGNSFATQSQPNPRLSLVKGDIDTIPIAKNADNPFQAHISIGRARNCDIVVRHRTVSKLHARFRLEGPALLLIDAESQNGTFLNGRRLVPNEANPVLYGAQLLFGSVPAKISHADAVYDLFRYSPERSA
jgi:hypothetical protein